MNIVIAERAAMSWPDATVEVIACSEGAEFPYEVWWCPESNRLQPLLCSVQRCRAAAIQDMNWAASLHD